MPTYDADARRVIAALPAGPRVVVIGSTSFYGGDSRELCEAVAANLAAVPLVALTGGMEGVGLTLGRAFAAARRAAGIPEHLFHLLPVGFGACDCGVTLEAGDDLSERREVLARVGDVYVVIEGGPGTEHEATVAAAQGAAVIPVGRTGGFAGHLHAGMVCPTGFPSEEWALLGAPAAPLERAVAAIGRLVRKAIS